MRCANHGSVCVGTARLTHEPAAWIRHMLTPDTPARGTDPTPGDSVTAGSAECVAYVGCEKVGFLARKEVTASG